LNAWITFGEMPKYARKAQFVGSLDPDPTFAWIIGFNLIGQFYCDISNRLLHRRIEQHVNL
jgi:hypothetical protein